MLLVNGAMFSWDWLEKVAELIVKRIGTQSFRIDAVLFVCSLPYTWYTLFYPPFDMKASFFQDHCVVLLENWPTKCANLPTFTLQKY